jgi:hypothetical protein
LNATVVQPGVIRVGDVVRSCERGLAVIKVALQCPTCESQMDEEISVKTGPPRWAANLWNKAVKAGWARDEDKHVAYCPSCRIALESPSTKLRPIQPLNAVTLIECEGCKRQLLGTEAVTDRFFNRDLRATAAEVGWKYITLDQGNTYSDYCPSCALTATQSNRQKLIRLVWSKPTQIAAWDMGISDKALEKQCKRLAVPKPPPGFWAKWHAGHIEECRALLPTEVEEVLGRESLDEIYPIER